MGNSLLEIDELVAKLREKYRHEPSNMFTTCPKCSVEVVRVVLTYTGRVAVCVDRAHCGWRHPLQNGDPLVIELLDIVEREWK